MKTKHVLDDLSAYMDGEASDPERIERHLQECPECAKRYAELCRLSGRLKDLPAPEAHPAFVTRVTAEVAEVAVTQRAPWLTRLGVASAGLALVLALVVAGNVYLRAKPATGPGTGFWAREFANADEETLIAEIEERIALEEEDFEDLMLACSTTPGYSNEVSGDELLEGLADADWFDGFADVWEQEADLEAVLLAMDESETEAFKELLGEYATEDWII